MLVRCPNCGTTYRLDDAKLSPEGTWVRCAKGCGEVFQVFPKTPPSPQPAAEAQPAPAPQQPEPSPAPQPSQPAATPKPKGKGFKVLFWLVALVILLAALGVGSLMVMQRLGIAPGVVRQAAQVPGLGWLLNKSAAKPAKPRPQVKLSLVGVRGFFRLNDMLGRVFVIQGRVQNEGPVACYKILIRGRLHDRKGRVVREAKVYAGGVLKPEELRGFSLKQITARLRSPKSPDGRWYVLRPGQSLPFMVLFYNLPANLSEFTVEVAGSEPAPPAVLAPPRAKPRPVPKSSAAPPAAPPRPSAAQPGAATPSAPAPPAPAAPAAPKAQTAPAPHTTPAPAPSPPQPPPGH